ncbi:MAG: Gfo/Idh/MocA family oxidoreductase [Thermoguttaceae bacterium]|jgi:predicted dehydrogenase|nr:Gfo/Idh/MocA family oxidoreductase [Thermoguttaceae bacterium]
MSTSRRTFLRHAAVAGAAFSVPMVASSRVLGANDELTFGIVGLGIRGSGAHLPGFQSQKGVRVLAIADPDQSRLDAVAKTIQSRYGLKVEAFQDMRKMFEMKQIDFIANATMNYWHALSTIWACQAGKHVYVEKPLSHFIWEGRQMVHAARKYNRLVQCGTQNRSNGTHRAAAQWIRAGNLGKIKYITCFANKPRVSCGKRDKPLEIPPSIDYDLWCGPSPKDPVYRDRLQYDCSFDWRWGDGESCNQGVHEIDIARLILGDPADLPRRTISIGGRFVFNDACDVPNTQIIYYDFPEAPVLYEVHNLRKAKNSKDVPDFRGLRTGVTVDCEGGWVDVYGGKAYDTKGKKVADIHGPGEDHFVNYVRALRSGKREDLAADVLVGHLSTRITHVGNLSYRVGAPAPVAEARKRIEGTGEFVAMYDRLLEHLKAHEVDPNTAILGQWLECDTANECIKGHAKANELVRGTYRAPYVVPDLSA